MRGWSSCIGPFWISAAGVHNVGPVKASWKTTDPAIHGFEKAFDIAWVSMSPAVQTLPDFEKMEQCARQWSVSIGWGRKRENDLMQEIFSLHGLAFGAAAAIVMFGAAMVSITAAAFAGGMTATAIIRRLSSKTTMPTPAM